MGVPHLWHGGVVVGQWSYLRAFVLISYFSDFIIIPVMSGSHSLDHTVNVVCFGSIKVSDLLAQNVAVI